MALKLRTVEKDGVTFAEVRNGKPVYIDDEKGNAEVEFDADNAMVQITKLNGESKNLRLKAETAESKLQAFGDLDPEKAKVAVQTVANLDDKKLMDAGEAQKVKDAAVKAIEDKYRPVEEENQTLKGQVKSLVISQGIATSQFVRDKMAIPAPVVEKIFGDHFSVEDGKAIAKDANGNPIYSSQNPGQPASIEEALPVLVNSYQFKDDILKGDGHQGSGAQNRGDKGSGKQTMTRAEFDKLPDAQKMDLSVKGEVELTD